VSATTTRTRGANPALGPLRWLGLAAPPLTSPTPPRAHRPARPLARSTAPPRGPLAWLGLAEPRIVLSGHPRIRARAAAVLARRRQRDRLVTASLAAVVAVALAGVGLVRSPLLSVEAVRLPGLAPAAAAELSAALGVPAGANVLDVDLDALAARAEGLPWVATASARRRLPSTVEVRVDVREPVLAVDVGGTRYLLDAAAVVVAAVPRGAASAVVPGDPGALPDVLATTAPVVGRRLADRGVQAAAAVAADMPPGIRPLITAYRPTADGQVDLVLQVPGPRGPVELTAHLGPATDVRAKAAALAALVAEVGRAGLPVRALDVRSPGRPVAVPG
jgi:cell division protein FtsQ